MAVDRRHLLDHLEEMAFEEQRAIRLEVDAAFFKPGWRGSPGLISASAVAIAAGLRRATARIADEACPVTEKRDAEFVADASRVARHLRIRLVGYYRQRLMSGRGAWSPEVTVKACGNLSESLQRVCDEMVDFLTRRSKPLPPALLPDLADPIPTGRGVVSAAPLTAVAAIPPTPSTAGRLSPQGLSQASPLRQSLSPRRPSLPIRAPLGPAMATSAPAISATPIITPPVPAALASTTSGIAPLIIAAPAPAEPIPVRVTATPVTAPHVPRVLASATPGVAPLIVPAPAAPIPVTAAAARVMTPPVTGRNCPS